MSRAGLRAALEPGLLTIVAVALAAAAGMHAGQWGWSWDALNHHAYLGLIAESPRWDLDVAAASVQSYQYPYLYWPAYRISRLPVDRSLQAGLWAGYQTFWLLPPLWLCAARLLPADVGPKEGLALRIAACAMGLCSVVILSLVETTANDLMAGVPVLWAIAIGMAAESSQRQAWACGLLMGLAIAFKLSAVLALPWLAIWWWQSQRPHLPVWRGLALCAGTLLGFGAGYLPWGVQLWRATGNPFYPNLGHWFGN